MKILIDGFFFQLAHSGIARVWEELIQHWTLISPDIKFYFINRGQKDIKLSGAETIDFPALPIEQCFHSWSLEPWHKDRNLLDELCAQHSIDIFMSTYYTYSTCTKNIMYIHDCIPEVFPDIYNMDEPIWKLKVEGIYHSHGYICVSTNTARDLLKYYDIKGRPIVVAENGVSDIFFQKRENYDKGPECFDKPYVLIPGLSEAKSYKNQKNALKALSTLVEDQRINVICTGGSATRHLREYQDVIDIDKIITGNYSLEDLLKLYHNAITVLYPSRYEGFGLPIIESFAAGTPVITCANSALREVGGDLAIYVDPDNISEIRNAVISTINADLRGFSTQAISRARRFNWNNTARKVDGFVRQLHLETKHLVWMEQNGF